jgi:hypothetical protein
MTTKTTEAKSKTAPAALHCPKNGSNATLEACADCGPLCMTPSLEIRPPKVPRLTLTHADFVFYTQNYGADVRWNTQWGRFYSDCPD